jgi:prepilin-type N-terminal cleavage/methylation domain-containing protein
MVTMTFLKANHRSAVTLTELLVVLAILSLLATIAVPVYVQKTEQARRAIARVEARNIAQAQESVLATHGFYVPIHTLDNIAPIPNGAGPNNQDTFQDHPDRTSIFAIDPFSDLQDQIGSQPSLNAGSTGSNSRVTAMVNYWSGPYLNPQRVYRGTNTSNDPGDLTQSEVSRDFVLDPWGRPYRMYSPIGIVGQLNPPSNTNDTVFTNNIPVTVDNGFMTQVDPRFDRFAIVSFGGNGLPDDVTGSNDDDIYYTFGFVPNETAFNIF